MATIQCLPVKVKGQHTHTEIHVYIHMHVQHYTPTCINIIRICTCTMAGNAGGTHVGACKCIVYPVCLLHYVYTPYMYMYMCIEW